jgi:galactokinase
MPTKNPRLTMTLSPLMAAQLKRMSELTGNSQASLVSELLEGSTTVFDRLIRVLEAAQGVKNETFSQFAGDMKASQAKMEKQLGLMLADFDGVTAPLIDHLEQIPRRGRKGTPGRASGTSGTSSPNPAQPAEIRPKRRSRDPRLLTGGSK